MRRFGWTASALFHLLLGITFVLVHIRVNQRSFELMPIDFISITAREAPAQPESPVIPVEESETPLLSEREEIPEPSEAGVREQVSSSVGIREGITWEAEPPYTFRLPISVPERTSRVSGPIRQALASTPSYLPLNEPGATVIDTLLFAQERLIQIAEDVLEAARAAPIGSHTTAEPVPVPGSIRELRGEPQLPVIAIAGAVMQALTNLGKKAWNRLMNRDPDADVAPDLDLNLEQVMAYAALDDYLPINIFEWYSRMHPQFQGGLNDLQQLAAALADRGLVRMDINDQMLVYRRIVPLRDVIEYFSSYLNRLPERSGSRRDELVTILSILVRIP